MEGRFKFNNPFVREQDEDVRMMPENCDSPPNSGMINDRKKTTTSSPKKRRAAQKRVVSIPIGDVSRVKGEGAPPSDSWAWRKYGQKPIKGSPYPRGYYRCSSSKGCPARKQVERSRVDPTMLVITYACEHNHSWPATKNSTTTTTTTTNDNKSRSEEPPVLSNQKETETEPDHKFTDLGDESLITTDDFGWFSYVASTTPTMLESPICSGNINEGADVAMIFPMGEEDESLFADLGELPECSVVFQRGFIEQEERRTRCSLREASWCQSTG